MIKKYLKVEIADTTPKHEIGLMFRKEVKEDEGMLFKFNHPHRLKFWGVNTYIPLDIAFISNDNKILGIENIKPLSYTAVESKEDCKMSIEANLGFFSKNDIKIGDKIEISEDGIYSFVKFSTDK